MPLEKSALSQQLKSFSIMLNPERISGLMSEHRTER